MGRRTHTALVYFGLAEDEEVKARLEAREPGTVWDNVAGGAFLMLAVAALWALARLVGVGNDLTELAIAEGMLVLLFVIATLMPDADEAPAPPRPPWREWVDHMSAVIALWSCIILVASLLGRRPADGTLTTIALWCASITVFDGARLAWRTWRRPRTG
jgi:hypothetical protein